VLQCGANSERLIVCGGGALNGQLMRRLQAHSPSIQVGSSQHQGLPPLQVEAAAFAWLARKTVMRETASLPKVTGAQGARILGALYASG
jgi:anhydro-N-acetylmuramic acid kinase